MSGESLREYARHAGWREALRVGTLQALQPLVLPVYRFVRRNYLTEDGLRLAKVEGTAMWWRMFGATAEPRDLRADDPRTADEVVELLAGYANRDKPLPDVGDRA